MKICIVTPEIAGAHKNGGIGTFCYHLCKLLDGHERTLIYTDNPATDSSSSWKATYEEMGIRVIEHGELPDNEPWPKIAPEESSCLSISRKVAEYLRESAFDCVHFQEWKAHGFHSIRLKRMGLALQGTALYVTMHSPAKWIRGGMHTLPEHLAPDLEQDFAERYCCENAEVVIAPSQHILNWAAREGWKIRGTEKVIPYCYHPFALDAAQNKPDETHLIFFGRLETRKGIGIFLEALDRLLVSTESPIFERISFLGKVTLHQGKPTNELIDAFSAKYPSLQIRIESGLDSQAALAYIRKTRGIVCMPSLLDNCPLGVIECIEYGLPFIAARSGGIPELARDACLFEPTVDGLEAALANLHSQDWYQDHPYSAKAANSKWKALHAIGPGGPSEAIPPTENKCLSERTNPAITVCIPYYNHGAYLSAALESLSRNTLQNFTVVVCDDGSSEPSAKRAFENAAQRYAGQGWRFIQQPNRGVAAARNRAAAETDTEYLLFMDADNIARPGMVDLFYRAALNSGADILTCYFEAFTEGAEPLDYESGVTPAYLYRPLGPAFPLYLLRNILGDANALVRRSTFIACNGFRNPDLNACADWDFFTRACLAGFDLDVIPQPLFWYRFQADGMLRRADLLGEERAVLLNLLSTSPGLQARFLTEYVHPLYHQIRALEKNIGTERFYSLSKTRTPWHKHIYRWYRRMLKDPRYLKK